MPDAAPTKAKTSAECKAEYDTLVKKVQAAVADGTKLEKKLLEEVKAKVKAHAGDLERLKEQKRAAHMAYESALTAEAASKAAAAPTTTPKEPVK